MKNHVASKGILKLENRFEFIWVWSCFLVWSVLILRIMTWKRTFMFLWQKVINFKVRHKTKTLDLFWQLSSDLVIECSDIGSQIAHFVIQVLAELKTKNLANSENKEIIIKTFFWNPYNFSRFGQIKFFTFVEFSPFFKCYYNLSNQALRLFNSLRVQVIFFHGFLCFTGFFGTQWKGGHRFSHAVLILHLIKLAMFALSTSHRSIVSFFLFLWYLFVHTWTIIETWTDWSLILGIKNQGSVKDNLFVSECWEGNLAIVSGL